MCGSRKKFTALLIWLVTGQATFTSQQCPLDPSGQWFVIQSPEPASARQLKQERRKKVQSTEYPGTRGRTFSCIKLYYSFIPPKEGIINPIVGEENPSLEGLSH